VKNSDPGLSPDQNSVITLFFSEHAFAASKNRDFNSQAAS
jgi:hypothetical protein